MKLFKKATVLMLAVVLTLGVFQVSAFADDPVPTEVTTVKELSISFKVSGEGDKENPAVDEISEGGVFDSISFLTEEGDDIAPLYMRKDYV